MIRKTLHLFLLACTALADPVPVRFNADAATPQTFQAAAYRGETLDIEAWLTLRGAPLAVADGASATMHWQTNGMGAAWWTAPASVTTSGIVRARWTPAMDCGADAYRIFLGVADGGSNLSYRANMLLRMVGSPGETPNALPLPTPFIDFAKVAWTNAPWGEGGGGGLSTNDVHAIIEADAGPTNRIVRMDEFNNVMLPGFLNMGDDIILSRGSPGAVISSDDQSGNANLGGTMWLYSPEFSFDDPSREIAVKGDLAPYAKTDDLSPYARTASLGSAAFKDATEFATATDEALVYQLMMGSNVVAEVTNYNSTVRSPQLRLLQLEEGQYKVVWAETNGLTRTRAEANAYTDAAIAELAGRKADRNWGKYTSGLGADAPSNTTWVSTPVTVIAGGYEYAKVITSAGEAWVLTSNGMSVGPDTNAYFRVATLDGESLFSVERSESVLVGVRAGGITCSGNTVSIPLDVVSAEAPVCYACDDLVSQNWVNLAETLPAWVTSANASGSAGSWVWTIETTATMGFFQFRALQEGRTVIRNNAPAELTQGIWVNGNRYVPVANGSTLTWTLAQ